MQIAMKTAILYLRVSTDEQALKGYSLRAQKEMFTNYCKPGRAPLGYKNKTYEDGKKYIAPEEPYAYAIKWAFQELSLGMSSMAEVHRKAFKLGLTCSINNFHSLVRNRIYCGNIRVCEIDGEEEHIIKGLHEPLITERLFEKVQNVLKGEVKPKKSAIATPKRFTASRLFKMS